MEAMNNLMDQVWLLLTTYGMRVVGVIAVLFAAFMAWVYIPSPKFEPAAYEPIRPDYWPTEGFRTCTPEEQGMDSATLLEIADFCQEAR